MGRDILSSIGDVFVLAFSYWKVSILVMEKIGGIMFFFKDKDGLYKVPFRKWWVMTRKALIITTAKEILRKLKLYNKPW